MAILKGIISKLNGSAGNLTFKQLGGPLALRAFQRAGGRSSIPSRVPKGRRPFQVEPEALFQRAGGSVPKGRRAFRRIIGRR